MYVEITDFKTVYITLECDEYTAELLLKYFSKTKSDPPLVGAAYRHKDAVCNNELPVFTASTRTTR